MGDSPKIELPQEVQCPLCSSFQVPDAALGGELGTGFATAVNDVAVHEDAVLKSYVIEYDPLASYSFPAPDGHYTFSTRGIAFTPTPRRPGVTSFIRHVLHRLATILQ